MKNKLDFLKDIAKNIAMNFANDKIIKIISLDKNEIYFLFLKNKKYVHLSFNFTFPYLNIVDKLPQYNKEESSLSNNELKKYLFKATLLSCEIVNNDKIIKLKFKKTFDTYETIVFNVCLEMFSNHPNIIITDEENVILSARHYTSITSNRLINKNIKYQLPLLSNSNYKEKEFDTDNFVLNYENEIQFNIIKKEFEQMFRFVKNRIKQLEKKIQQITLKIEKQNEFEIYKEAGDYIFTNLDKNFDKININNKEIVLDKKYDLITNANLFYKKYKKLKSGLKIDEEILNKSKDELCYLSNINSQLNNKINSYEDIKEIYVELIKNNYIKIKENIKKTPANLPYIYKTDDVEILFGKNNLQNDRLTFSIAKKDDLFFHTKGYSGSHVILRSKYINDKNIEISCKIALFLSNLYDGEIQFTEVKNVKKSNIKGLVHLLSYKVIYINKYDYLETKQIISDSKKVGL